MTAFPTRKFYGPTGEITGEVVANTTINWQVAVAGQIVVLPKSEWSMSSDFEEILGFFGGRP